MQYCKTCNSLLNENRVLGELKDFCSISCSNKNSIFNKKRLESRKNTVIYNRNYIPPRTLFLSNEELKNEILKRQSSQGLNVNAAKNLELKPEILEATSFLEHADWPERLYCIKNNISTKTVCTFCKINFVKFAQPNIGYRRFCSTKCSAQAESTKNERAKTNIKIYGNAVAFRNENVKLKQQETLKARYNVYNSWHLAKHSGISKISQELFWNVWQNSNQDGESFFGELNGELRIVINGKLFKPDYAQIDNDDKRIIEFDGGYWHTSESLEHDLERENALKNEGWKILRIKEKDYNSDKLETICKCIAFLNKDIE